MSLATPLINTAELVERSIFHNIRAQLVAKGFLPDITLFTNTQAGQDSYNNALTAIRNNLGYCIEVFGAASPHSRDLKRMPRIVIVADQAMPGALGGNPDRFYEGEGPDPTAPTGFTAKVLPPQTTDFSYDIHIVWNEIRQKRVMEQIVGLAMPKRGYIPLYLDPVTLSDKKFFVLQVTHRNLDANIEGIGEAVFSYSVPDIFEIESTIVETGIPPMEKITVEHTKDPHPDAPPITSFTITT